MEQDMERIVRRVDRLEQQNRLLRRMLVAAILVPGMLGLAAMQQAVPRVVEAESFVVKDSNGKRLAVLGRHGEYHGLNLFDAKGRPAASFAMDRMGSSLGLNDDRGRSVTVSATTKSVGIAVAYESHGIGAALGVTDQGPDLVLRDKAGKVLFHRPE